MQTQEVASYMMRGESFQSTFDFFSLPPPLLGATVASDILCLTRNPVNGLAVTSGSSQSFDPEVNYTRTKQQKIKNKIKCGIIKYDNVLFQVDF